MPDTDMFRLFCTTLLCILQALAMAAKTLAQPQRLSRATSQGLRPTESLVLHMARTLTPTPLATLATKGMAAATLVVEWPATSQALRPTESLVLQVVRTPTATLAQAATRAMAATLAQVQQLYCLHAGHHACNSSHLNSMVRSYLPEDLGAMLLLDHASRQQLHTNP